MTDKKLHPIQPIIQAENGVLRFKENKIVKFLLEHGPFNLNDIAVMDFSKEDRQQLTQLIGYSLSGASDLDHMSSEIIDAAEEMFTTGGNEVEVRNAVLREKLDEVKSKVLDLYDLVEEET
jgi:hypothetical protein